MKKNLTMSAYARRSGVKPETIRYAVTVGKIVRDAQGLIDPAQADKDWLAQHQTIVEDADNAGGDLLRGRMDSLESDLKLKRDEYEKTAEQYAPRWDAERLVYQEIAAFRDFAENLPERQAAKLAMHLGISNETARSILADCAAAILADIEQLRAEAVDMLVQL